MRLITQIRRNRGSIHWKRDIFSGIVIALVSIPISMGYAEIAGLPPVYGLYGSVLPILLYGLFTTSKQFVVGVDAMPAVMVGSLLARMGIAGQSREARILVPVLAFFTAGWFLVLHFLKAGRIVRYISVPVMGGFISGVGMTIILMQIPKLYGETPGTGEVIALFQNIWEQRRNIHFLSAALGFGTIAVILFCKRKLPKVPMTVVMMIAGAALQIIFRLDQYGVPVMQPVKGGFPAPVLPGFEIREGFRLRFALTDVEDFALFLPDLVMQSLGIAAVIMAQTLLASGNYAAKYRDDLDRNAELLAYAAMNFGSAFVGCCPVNGSVSRSGIADAQGTRSQVMSLCAAVTMLIVLLFGTPLIGYLPVPILTGIVITALIGILEIEMAKKLWITGKNEFLIFLLAGLGVLFFGTVYGVVIGVLLSFGEVAMRATMPPTAFVGRIPGHGNFYSLKRNSAARPVKNTLIYRFSGNLFFANIDLFCSEIEAGLREDTHQVVVDGRGIGNIDITATEKLVRLYQSLRERGILFYLTEHDGSLNDQLRMTGGGILIEEGAVRRTITLALRDAGLEKPYELEKLNPEAKTGFYNRRSSEKVEKEADAGKAEPVIERVVAYEADERLSEFEWVFGAESEKKMEELARSMAERLVEEDGKVKQVEEEMLNRHGVRTDWGMLGRFDEDAFWDFMEIRLEEMVREGRITPEFAARTERHIERRREFGQEKLEKMNPHAARILAGHGEVIRNYLKHKYPKEYEKYLELRGSEH